MAVAATGFFDGVHIGHRSVIETLVLEARRRGEESLILTFWPHPRLVLGSAGSDFALIEDLDGKIARLRSYGVDRVEVTPFTKEFAALRAEEYLTRIRDKYGVTCLVLGYDNHMGSDRMGPQSLVEICSGLGMDSIVVPPVELCSEGKTVTVSSTKIRKAIGEGKLDIAEEMLGHSVK